MVKKRNSKKKISKRPVRKTPKIGQGLAIAALILNILILPGLGTLIGGKTREGVWQIILSIVGALLVVIIIGFPIMIGAWIWGLVSGINLIKESKQ